MHRPVLDIDAPYAGEGLMLLDLPVNHVIVAAVADGPEAVLDVDVGAKVVARTPVDTLFRQQRVFTPAIAPVVNHDVVVVHRNPEMAVHQRFLTTAGADLGERHDEMVGPDVVALITQGPDAVVPVAVVSHVHFQRRGRALDEGGVEGNPRLVGFGGSPAVKNRCVGRVDAAFQSL